MIVHTAEASSRCSSWSDCNMLLVWFSCNPFVPSDHGLKITAAQGFCIKDKQYAVERVFVSVGTKGAEIH